MLATWQIFLPESTVLEIEANAGVKRKVTDKVRTFWREFKPQYHEWETNNDLQGLIDSDNLRIPKIEKPTKDTAKQREC